MNQNGDICIGMAGAGRATELHMNALKRFSGVPVCLKHIIAQMTEQVEYAQKRFGFEKYSLSFEDLLNDKEIDVIDICTPPYVHEEMVIEAIKAGKHVICEKPLSGYFGKAGDIQPIGKNISKAVMYDELLKSLERVRSVLKNSDMKFLHVP